ncbi:MAG TPA: amino acid permease [Terriglobales bacterium]|nr:amino acid permease [Terriglobales bacterium]
MAQKEPKLYVRPASGLVREVSATKALAFSLGSAVAWEPAWVPVFVTLGLPAFLIGGWTSLSFGVVVAGIFTMFVLSPIYAYLAAALPRSGGDQVYTTRITHPLLGFVESWTFIFSIFAFMGYGLNVLVYTLSASLRIVSFLTPDPWNAWSAALTGSTGMMIVGTVIMALIFLVSMQPTRRFHSLNAIIVFSGLILSAAVVPFAFGIDPTAFATNLQAFTGKTVQGLIQEAANGGFAVGAFSIAGLGLVLGTGLLEFVGFQYTGFIAGELKGNVSRSIVFAFSATCLVVIVIHTFFLQLIVNAFGSDFLFAMSYLYYTTGTAPVIPLAQTLIAIAKPEISGIMAISAFGSFLIGFGLAICWVTTASRTAFAWSMDRLIPTSFSKIDARTKQPLRLICLFVAIWYVSFIGSVYGYTFITGALTSILLSMFVWILPGVNALLLPFRRKDLYELIPASMRKNFGIPVISILGIIWLCFAIPVFFLYAFWPIIGAAYGSNVIGVLNVALTTGLVLFVSITIAGIVVYFLSQWYNKRHGIDMSLLFKTVPPE